ncbi:MAG: hypothetical protein Q7K20_10380 [Polaromonas sp.]|nr:hypothetical protein [Polaromonas sp.]
MKRSHRLSCRTTQSGAVLLIGMIMLLMLMLVAVGVIRLSMSHTQIINNEQVRTEADTATNYALDMVLNAPANTWDGYRNAGKKEYINLGTSVIADSADVSVAVTVNNLTCKRSRIIRNSEMIKTTGSLTYVPADDSSCFGGGGSPLTIVDPTALGPPNADSLCANVLYEMQATTSDPKLLGAGATVIQGVEVRRGVDALDNCD